MNAAVTAPPASRRVYPSTIRGQLAKAAIRRKIDLHASHKGWRASQWDRVIA
jgi:hypothetical protein